MDQRRVSDPTAGERARRVVQHPGQPQPIFDPTDPRAAAHVPRSTAGAARRRETKKSDPEAA